MTLKEISLEIRELARAYNNQLYSRNIIIDDFNREYERHVKLNKYNDRQILLLSLSKSRNMKKLQKDLIEVKNNIKNIQSNSKKFKMLYKGTEKSLVRNNTI